MMKARLGLNSMRHFWWQSSDSIDLDHLRRPLHPATSPGTACMTGVPETSLNRNRQLRQVPTGGVYPKAFANANGCEDNSACE
jgi:hypothetical protein